MKRKSTYKNPTKTMVRETFNRRYENDLKNASKYLKEHYGSDIIKHQKLSYSFFSRRIKAYSNYAKFICAVAGERLQALDIEKELSFIGSLPFMTNLDWSVKRSRQSSSDTSLVTTIPRESTALTRMASHLWH